MLKSCGPLCLVYLGCNWLCLLGSLTCLLVGEMFFYKRPGCHLECCSLVSSVDVMAGAQLQGFRRFKASLCGAEDGLFTGFV
jgi:hypothetical protein